jgi:hypothetical protein
MRQIRDANSLRKNVKIVGRRIKMNRETLSALGLTDEQINEVMKEHGKDIQAEKQKAEGYKTDSVKLAELTKQLELMKNAQSEKDKTIETKDTQYDELKKQFESLQSELKTKELKANLAEKGIVGENADKLIQSLAGGTLDVELLGAIISEKETNAVDAKVKELAGQAGNPGGSQGNGNDPEKTDAEKMAESIGKSFAESQKASNDVLAQYI